jgi:hypothetical protein
MDEMKKSFESTIKGKETVLVVDDDQDIVRTMRLVWTFHESA